MKNRDKLMQMNLYDLLLKLHYRSSDCILYLLTGKDLEKDCHVMINGDKMKCENCIQKWLNQNVDF